MAKCVVCQRSVVEEPREKMPSIEEIRQFLSRLEEEEGEEKEEAER